MVFCSSQKEHKTIFSSLKIGKMALSGQRDATALFSAVCYTLCDTYIDYQQSVNSGKSIFRNFFYIIIKKKIS